MYSNVCFANAFYDLRPIRGVGYPVGVINAEDCVGGYVPGSEGK